MLRLPKTNTKRHVILLSIMLIGYPLLLHACYSEFSKALFYAKEGIPQEARVVKLERTEFIYKGGTNYYYLLNINGELSRQSFYVRYKKGQVFPVLISPLNSNEMVIGSKKDDFIDIFRNEIGMGRWMAIASIILFIWCFVYSPKMIYEMLFKPDDIWRSNS